MTESEFIVLFVSQVNNNREVHNSCISKVDLWLFSYNTVKLLNTKKMLIDQKLIYKCMLEYCNKELFHSENGAQVAKEIYAKWQKKK